MMKRYQPAVPYHSREGGQTISLIPVGGIATLHYVASERRAQAIGNAKSGGRIGGRTGFVANRKTKTMTTTPPKDQAQQPSPAAAPPQFQLYTYVSPFAPYPYPAGTLIGLDGFSLLGCILAFYVMFLALWRWITPKR